jgi:hypothetical protein
MADDDFIYVAPYDRIEPNRRVLADGHVADDLRRSLDETAGCNSWVHPLIAANHDGHLLLRHSSCPTLVEAIAPEKNERLKFAPSVAATSRPGDLPRLRNLALALLRSRWRNQHCRCLPTLRRTTSFSFCGY